MASTSARNSPLPEDEEPDFMSDVFLVEQETKKDVRPGLLFNPRDRREHELKKKQEHIHLTHKTKSKKSLLQQQDEQREEKLNQEIDSSNKGFRLLEKMGYKPGMGIGPRDDGIKVPIPIELKRSRLGLGEKTKNEEKRRRIEERKEELEQLTDPSAYRVRLREIAENKDILRDLKKAQNACQTLDTSACLAAPVEVWYWPEIKKPKRDSEDDSSDHEIELEQEEEIQPEPREKLQTLVGYLREKYFYCIWCGTAYENKEDLISCPGTTKEEH